MNKSINIKHIVLIFFMLLFSIACESDKTIYNKPLVEGDRIVIDTRSMGDSSPEFFSIALDKKRVNFFIVKVGGLVEAYLDACENCYQFRKGYRVEGSYVICRHCGSTYPLDSLRTGLGTCHPMPLEGEQDGGKYYISLKEIKKAESFF